MNVGYKICFFVLIFQNTKELIRKFKRKYKRKNESGNDRFSCYANYNKAYLVSFPMA